MTNLTKEGEGAPDVVVVRSEDDGAEDALVVLTSCICTALLQPL